MRQALLKKSLPFCLSPVIPEIMDFESCDYFSNNLLIHPESVEPLSLGCHDSPGEDDFALPQTQKDKWVIGLNTGRIPSPDDKRLQNTRP